MTAQPATTVSSASAAAFRFSGTLAGAVERCWRRANPPLEWAIERSQFEAALERSAGHRFPGASASRTSPDDKQVEAYLDVLHTRDLALARACSAGNEAAWEFFVTEYRQELYRAARAVTGSSDSSDPAARELADTLYADLYGLREAGGGRKSLFDYFHGRSKLSTWLRAVLAQRYVDEIRRTRRMQSIENEDGEIRPKVSVEAQAFNSPELVETADPERSEHMAILQVALVGALDALAPRDRLRLAYYYADGMTLADIGRLLGEHEATVSRKLDRTRRDLRRAVEVKLRDDKKLSEYEVQACFEHAREEWPFDLTDRLRSE